MQGKKKGKTRAEAFAELDIKPVEIMAGGELKLPSGKIIGHKDYKYIYRQRPVLPDMREAVVIAKLQHEYKAAGIKGNSRLAIGHGNNALCTTEQRKEIKATGKD